jgi:hypothetical protein
MLTVFSQTAHEVEERTVIRKVEGLSKAIEVNAAPRHRFILAPRIMQLPYKGNMSFSSLKNASMYSILLSQ